MSGGFCWNELLPHSSQVHLWVKFGNPCKNFTVSNIPPVQIEESLREPINVKPLNSLPVIDVDEGNEEEGGLVRKKRGHQTRMEGPTEFKARDFLDGRADEIAPEILEMLPAEAQAAAMINYKYWTDKYASYAETCEFTDMLEAGLAMQARSQGFIFNAQMDMKRLQDRNRELEERTATAELEAEKLKAEASTANEVIEAFKTKQEELEAKVGQLSTENVELKEEVHLCKSEVNALTKRVENSDNLQKIASTALEVANQDRTALKAQVTDLTAEVGSLKQQLVEAGDAAVETIFTIVYYR